MTIIKHTLLTLSFALAAVALSGGCSRQTTGEEPVQSAVKPVPAAQRAQTANPPRASEAPDHDAPLAISAAALVEAFNVDPAAAGKRFARRTVTITGEVTNVEAQGSGVPVITLKSGMPNAGPHLVLQSDAWAQVSSIGTGGQISVVCKGIVVTAGQVTSTACAVASS